MEQFISIKDLAQHIEKKFNSGKKNIFAIYAFNSTGKTRLTSELASSESEEIMSLYYSVFLEDIFVWNNEEYTLHFDPNSWIIKLVIDQGLEGEIVNSFKDITQSKIEPSFDFENGLIEFKFATGDDNNTQNIKISKGEESIFIWSVFYTVLEIALGTLQEEKDNRTTEIFNKLKYVIIDDPVSSLDDTRIITTAIRLCNLISNFKDKSIKFLITTHHALFFNIIVNSLKRGVTQKNFEAFKIKINDKLFELSRQGDSPFGYHLVLKDAIQTAIITNNIQRYHFNLFRSLLEKTANFLGIESWTDCIYGDNRIEFIRLLNLHSHNRLADLESSDLSPAEKVIFRQTFEEFIQKYFHNKKII